MAVHHFQVKAFDLQGVGCFSLLRDAKSCAWYGKESARALPAGAVTPPMSQRIWWLTDEPPACRSDGSSSVSGLNNLPE